MRHIQQRAKRVTAHVVTMLALAAAACTTTTGSPADANTARVFIDGREIPTTFTVDCTQLSWLWTIETLPKEPGFTAIIQTGGTVGPKVMRIRDLTGFTGAAQAEATDAKASIEGTAFHLSGTAHGSFADRPTKPADVHFRMEAHC